MTPEDLVKQFEGFRSDAYRDGGGVWTIGWGSTHGVRPGMRISLDEAQDMLQRDLQEAQNCISHAVQAPLNPNQNAALVSFVYNIGTIPFRESTMLRFLNMANAAGTMRAAKEFLRWNHVDGKVDRGLTKRRQKEHDLFLSPPTA